MASLPAFTRSSCSFLSGRTYAPGRQYDRVLAQAAAFDGCQVPLPKPVKIVGCGSCGVDYLASVAAYPKPDQKLRTDALAVQGGGNCANALTAAARLGLSPTLVTKVCRSSILARMAVAICMLVHQHLCQAWHCPARLVADCADYIALFGVRWRLSGSHKCLKVSGHEHAQEE
ncbi:hypothetical protein COO60DRAFT_543168 [Scenedesmus sp. NREL 46B-D3]|nr:hypothetical protein COO60DRAFT_543168 [Scenedesmus sp. NREL 46B-D3]